MLVICHAMPQLAPRSQDDGAFNHNAAPPQPQQLHGKEQTHIMQHHGTHLAGVGVLHAVAEEGGEHPVRQLAAANLRGIEHVEN